MDFQQVNKDTLRAILDQTPNTPQNAQLRSSLIALITKKTIQPIPYTYSAAFWTTGAANNLAAGAVGVGNVPIQADADFLILNQTYWASTANAAVASGTYVYPNATVLLQNTGSGYQFMDQAVPVTSIFGNGQFPYVLPSPQLLPAKATLQVTVTNRDAAAGYNIILSFNGVKLFSYD